MMKKLFGIALIVIAIAACSKTSDPPLTSDEIFARDILAIDTYLASQGITPLTHPSGIRYIIKQTGTGPSPNYENCVRINYAGYFLNDTTKFDVITGDGYKFAMVHLVSGLELALKQMNVGAKADVYMPSVLGYGAAGKQNADASYIIPPNQVLVFKDVELLQLYGFNYLGGYCNE